MSNGSTAELSSINLLREQAISSINQSSTDVDRLRSDPSQGTAESACSSCRNAVQLVFFARGRIGASSKDRIDELYENIDTAIDIISDYGQKAGVDPVVHDYVRNLEWRRDLLFALTTGDKEEISRLLDAA